MSSTRQEKELIALAFFALIILLALSTFSTLVSAEEETGSIYVHTDPGEVKIYVDEEYSGMTHFYYGTKTVQGVTAGTYTLKLAKDGYKDWSKSITVEAGEGTEIYAYLEQGSGSASTRSETFSPSSKSQFGTIDIHTDPGEVKIYVDEEYSGMTHFYYGTKTVQGVTAGTYTLKLAKDGYKDWSKSITVGAGEGTEIYTYLEPIPTPSPTSTSTSTPTPTPTPTPIATPSPIPTASLTPVPTPTPTVVSPESTQPSESQTQTSTPQPSGGTQIPETSAEYPEMYFIVPFIVVILLIAVLAGVKYRGRAKKEREEPIESLSMLETPIPPPSEEERKISGHDVFICYSSKDKPVADAMVATLESKGIRCWIAPRDVLPGISFQEAIIDAIDSTRIMVLIFSSHSNNSPHVIRELTEAVSKGVIIIPFRIEDVLPSKSMKYLISVPHWLDAYTPPLEQHLEKLAETIQLFLKETKNNNTEDKT